MPALTATFTIREQLANSLLGFSWPVRTRYTNDQDPVGSFKMKTRTIVFIALGIFLFTLFLGLSVYMFYRWKIDHQLWRRHTRRLHRRPADDIELGPLPPQCLQPHHLRDEISQAQKSAPQRLGADAVEVDGNFQTVDLEEGHRRKLMEAKKVEEGQDFAAIRGFFGFDAE